jgi:hypothetical protein
MAADVPAHVDHQLGADPVKSGRPLRRTDDHASGRNLTAHATTTAGPSPQSVWPEFLPHTLESVVRMTTRLGSDQS